MSREFMCSGRVQQQVTEYRIPEYMKWIDQYIQSVDLWRSALQVGVEVKAEVKSVV